jgi:hypothetical protein
MCTTYLTALHAEMIMFHVISRIGSGHFPNCINHIGLSNGDSAPVTVAAWSKAVVSTCGTRTPGGTRRHIRGYAKLKIILFHDKH